MIANLFTMFSWFATVFFMVLPVVTATNESEEDVPLFRRLRRHATGTTLNNNNNIINEGVYDKYLDLADLVTDERTLHLVEERRGKTLGKRQMMGLMIDELDEVLSDSIRLLELNGMSVVSPSEFPTVAPSLSLSMSL